LSGETINWRQKSKGRERLWIMHSRQKGDPNVEKEFAGRSTTSSWGVKWWISTKPLRLTDSRMAKNCKKKRKVKSNSSASNQPARRVYAPDHTAGIKRGKIRKGDVSPRLSRTTAGHTKEKKVTPYEMARYATKLYKTKPLVRALNGKKKRGDPRPNASHWRQLRE